MHVLLLFYGVLYMEHCERALHQGYAPLSPKQFIALAVALEAEEQAAAEGAVWMNAQHADSF